jgi:hypothetical protein
MTNDHRRAIPKTRYGVAVDVKHAADLYAQGQTLRQIAAQLDLTETTVRDQLRRAGVATCRRSIQRSLVRCEASYHAPVLG